MALSFVLSNGREFKSQKAAKEHFRQILRAYDNGQMITDPSDHEDLVALLERYDNAITDTPSKIGTGIDHSRGGPTQVADTRRQVSGLFARTVQARIFGFYTGVEGKPKPRSHEFADACRAAVADDLKAAKKRHFQLHGDDDGHVLCDITDQPISFDEAQLDHAYPTFGVMVVMFRAARGWHDQIPANILTVGQDQQTTTTFVDPSIARQFRDFHHRGARLRVISAKRNLAMASGQRTPKIKRLVLI